MKYFFWLLTLSLAINCSKKPDSPDAILKNEFFAKSTSSDLEKNFDGLTKEIMNGLELMSVKDIKDKFTQKAFIPIIEDDFVKVLDLLEYTNKEKLNFEETKTLVKFIFNSTSDRLHYEYDEDRDGKFNEAELLNFLRLMPDSKDKLYSKIKLKVKSRQILEKFSTDKKPSISAREFRRLFSNFYVNMRKLRGNLAEDKHFLKIIAGNKKRRKDVKLILKDEPFNMSKLLEILDDYNSRLKEHETYMQSLFTEHSPEGNMEINAFKPALEKYIQYKITRVKESLASKKGKHKKSKLTALETLNDADYSAWLSENITESLDYTNFKLKISDFMHTQVYKKQKDMHLEEVFEKLNENNVISWKAIEEWLTYDKGVKKSQKSKKIDFFAEAKEKLFPNKESFSKDEFIEINQHIRHEMWNKLSELEIKTDEHLDPYKLLEIINKKLPLNKLSEKNQHFDALKIKLRELTDLLNQQPEEIRHKKLQRFFMKFLRK